jgi:hypothetical protein
VRTHATVTVETVYAFGQGHREAIRVVVHDEDGNKPRTAKGKQGVLIVAKETEDAGDLLRSLAGLLDQESTWDGVRALFEGVRRG